MQMLTRIFKLLVDSFQAWNEDRAARLAAALAFYALLSLSPLLIVIVGLTGSFIGQESIKNELTTQVQSTISADAARLVNTIIENNTQPGASLGATIVGVLLLLFGASGVFTQLYESMNTVWHIRPDHERSGAIQFLIKRALAILMVLLVGLILIGSLIASTVLAILEQLIEGIIPGAQLIGLTLNFLLSIGIITFVFALIFKYVPAVHVRWRDVLPGALLTSILFVIGENAISFYLGRSSIASVYGATGSIVVILIWIYFSAQILFFGAEFTAVYAERFGDGIRPATNAVFEGKD